MRGTQVMLDSNLAASCGVETKVFHQAVRRKAKRFPGHLPERFRFQLTREEADSLILLVLDDVIEVRRLIYGTRDLTKMLP